MTGSAFKFRGSESFVVGKTLVLLFTVFISTACGSSNRNYVLTTGTTPLCTSEQISEWDHVWENSMGVRGRDPIGHRTGSFNADGTWYPYSVFKQTLCGELDRFNFYDPWFSGDEADWNNFMIPDPAYDFIFSYGLVFIDIDEFVEQVHDCPAKSGSNNCMEVEITPDEGFYNNPWFPKGPGGTEAASTLEGERLCTYGPWVADEGHGFRPEIHPSELVWWKHAGDRGDVYHLLLLQDDSNRFDRPGDFSVGDPPPAWWHPWSENPRRGEFRMAFSLNPQTDPLLTWDIFEMYARNVVTSGDLARLDSDDGSEHAIEYNGTVVLRVREQQPNDNDLGVRFEEVCRNLFNTRIQGYVTISSLIGRGDRGDEGYHALRVYTEQGSDGDVPPFTLPVLENVTALGNIVPETIGRSDAGGKVELVADVEVSLIGSEGASQADLIVSKAELFEETGEVSLDFQIIRQNEGSNMTVILVEDFPILSGSRIKLSAESGLAWHLSSPAVSLALSKSETPLDSHADPAAWVAVATAAGGSPDARLPSSVRLLRLHEVQLDVEPRYAPEREGSISPEDDSPVSETLNEILERGDEEQIRELFGTNRPIHLEWSFEATNLTTGELVPVAISEAAGPKEIRVEFLESEATFESIKVTFPDRPENGVYELLAVIEMEDSFGNLGEALHRIRSHALFGEDRERLVESLIPLAASLAGAPPNDLVAQSSLDFQDDSLAATQPRSLIGPMLRLVTFRLAADKLITMGELESLIRGAKLFGEG